MGEGVREGALHNEKTELKSNNVLSFLIKKRTRNTDFFLLSVVHTIIAPFRGADFRET